jgi:hypothetical protein
MCVYCTCVPKSFLGLIRGAGRGMTCCECVRVCSLDLCDRLRYALLVMLLPMANVDKLGGIIKTFHPLGFLRTMDCVPVKCLRLASSPADGMSYVIRNQPDTKTETKTEEVHVTRKK